ncbi:Callose synthase 2 [Triticum urartu]|uniref:Callose synthase 2 n=1 Tax=Triticum urartu TaxID=4572 RepID=M7YGW6_TRIUA|nr:Callose synthase 2 [Triticum urartu]
MVNEDLTTENAEDMFDEESKWSIMDPCLAKSRPEPFSTKLKLFIRVICSNFEGRFYAFEKAHRFDPTSSGRGVRQFKISLLERLDRDNTVTLEGRKEKGDALEMEQFYLYYCENFMKTLQDAVGKAGRDLLTKLHRTEAVLFEVLKAVNVTQTVGVDQAVLEMHCKIEENRELVLLPPPLSPSEQATLDRWRWMDIKCVIPNVLDQILQDGSAEPISIPLALLQNITENFADERKIGQGGFGVVYKEKDIVHMDLKPENILMDDLMIPKVTDFGISKHLDGISQAVTRGCTMSLGYCAPEYLHRGQLSFKTDIFSLGVIIIDLVTGRKEDPDIKNVLRRWRYRWNRSAKYPPLGYQQVTECIEIAARCVSHDPKEQPHIWDIISQLNEMESKNGHVNNANEFTVGLISSYPWELLDIDPLELHFPSAIDKQIPCSLQLSNPRDDYIAFYVQTSSGQYLIEPNKGIVPPQSKSNVIITFRAQKMAPHCMMYKDEFIVRCTMVNEDLTIENVTEDMFDEESKVVDNVNLTVAF